MKRPYWKKSHSCWYFNNDAGKPIRLDPDDDEAHRIWQAMRDAASELSHPRVQFRALANQWLEDHKYDLSDLKYEQIQRRLIAFCEHCGPMEARDLTNSYVLSWVKQARSRAKAPEDPARVKKSPKRRSIKESPPKPWSLDTQRDVLVAIKRVLRWAHETGKIAVHPLAGLRIPKGRPRQRTVLPEEHEKLVAAVRKQKSSPGQFALYLIASHCGARPQQIREVTAANVHASGQAWVFRDHKTVAKTGKPLVVYLHPCLQTITRLLVAKHPCGPLFRDENGNAWKKDRVSLRLRRIRKKLGMKDVVAYSYRHTFATDALLAGVPIATVSALLGHTSTRMVSEVYGHLDQHFEHLSEAARKIAEKRME